MDSFTEDVEIVLESIEMPLKHREMIKKLYGMLEDFDIYGVIDSAIIKDPKFVKCREYAKLVYEELSGDDLDAWEKSRQKAKPLNIKRKEMTAKEMKTEEQKIYPRYLIEKI